MFVKAIYNALALETGVEYLYEYSINKRGILFCYIKIKIIINFAKLNLM